MVDLVVVRRRGEGRRKKGKDGEGEEEKEKHPRFRNSITFSANYLLCKI
jgi:hypothetical protein